MNSLSNVFANTAERGWLPNATSPQHFPMMAQPALVRVLAALTVVILVIFQTCEAQRQAGSIIICIYGDVPPSSQVQVKRL